MRNTTDPIPATHPDNLMSRRRLLGLMGGLGAGAGALILTGCDTATPKATPNHAEVTTAASETPTASASPEAAIDSDPLSAQNLWEATPEQRLDLYRSLLPESIIKAPEKFTETKIEITAALYNMLGNQAAYDAWLEKRYASGQSATNEEWAEYTYDLILGPAFSLLDGREPTGDNKQGVLDTAARAGIIVEQQNQMNHSGGTPIVLPPYEYSYKIMSITPKNVSDTRFDVAVKMAEGDNITQDTIDKINTFTGQDWKTDITVGGALAFEWTGVHYDNKTNIALPSGSITISD